MLSMSDIYAHKRRYPSLMVDRLVKWLDAKPRRWTWYSRKTIHRAVQRMHKNKFLSDGCDVRTVRIKTDGYKMCDALERARQHPAFYEEDA